MAALEVMHDWRLQARESQLEPEGDWWIWLLQTGRGWGKSRTALESARRRIDDGRWRTVLAAGPTWQDVMDTIVKGSELAPGFMRLWPAHMAPQLRLSKDDPHMTCWNGAKIRLRAAQSADRFRGPNNDGAVVDEIDSWKPEGMSPSEAFALAELSVRTGPDPRIFASSTPKRGRLISELRKRDDVIVTTGSMRENEQNLAATFVRAMENRYAGTRLGRQELDGELLDEIEGALLTHQAIEAARVDSVPEGLRRIVIGVDPAATSGDSADETGIVAAGRRDAEAWVLADRTCRMPPDGWARQVVDLYHDLGADLVVAEKNNGGEMVLHTLRTVDRNLPVKLVTATRGKHVRAEPVLALYEQGRIHHVGRYPQLEDQLCSFTAEGYDGDSSPDNADAGIWALTELIVARTGVTPSDLYGPEATAQP